MNQMMQMQCSAACHPAPSFMKVLEQALFIQNERKAIRHLSAALLKEISVYGENNGRACIENSVVQ